jgi:hypothetical protein
MDGRMIPQKALQVLHPVGLRFHGPEAVESGRKLGEQAVIGIDHAFEVSLLRRAGDEAPVPEATVVSTGVSEVG